MYAETLFKFTYFQIIKTISCNLSGLDLESTNGGGVGITVMLLS